MKKSFVCRSTAEVLNIGQETDYWELIKKNLCANICPEIVKSLCVYMFP
jgi:hypothetical protein